MAVKPVLTIDLDDSAFKRFYDLFAEYSAQLDEQPELWRQLGDAMGEAGHALGQSGLKEQLALAAAQAGIITEALKEATAAQHGLDRASTKTGKAMHGVAKAAKDIGSAISFVGGWIVKLGALGGLGGILSGFGIEDLANAAFSRERQAGQYGISPGLLASFKVNAQQFLPVSALESAANAQIDATKAGYLSALGISWGKAQGMNPSDLAFTELLHARAAYLQAQKAHLPALQMPAVSSYLALGGSLGDIRNAAMQPVSAILAAQAKTQADRSQLEISRQTAQEWTELKKAMDLAGLSIQTDLVNKLVPLAPELTRLTEGVVNAVAAFIGGKNFNTVIKDVKSDIGELADFIEHTDWKRFGSTMSLVFDEVEAVAKKLSWLVPKKNNKPVTPWDWMTPSGSGHTGWAREWLMSNPITRPIMLALKGTLEGGVTPGMVLGAIALQESGAHYNSVNRTSGASGRYQFMPGTAAEYLPSWWVKKYGDTIGGRARAPWLADQGHVQDLVALGYYHSLESQAYKLSHIHDNVALIAAGWYGGGSAMDALYHKRPWAFRKQDGGNPSVAGYSASVIAHLRDEWRQYHRDHATAPHRTTETPRVRARRKVAGTTHIAITNSTSARVAVAVNAVAV